MQIPEFITFFETTRPTPQPVSMYHGTCADLVAVIQTNGDTIDESTLAEYTATALFEVLSDSDDEELEDEEEIVSDENGDIAVIGPKPKEYFEIPVEIRGNTCVVKWQGNLDSGANAIKIYLRLSKTSEPDEPDVIAYPATWTVRFQESPGFNPSMLEPLPEEIDFDLVKYVNAPWVTLSAYETSFNELSSDLSNASNDLNALSSNVLELSNDVSTLSTFQSNINSDITEVRQDIVNVQSDVLSLSTNKADLSDVVLANDLIVLQEPDYINTYEPVYKGEYPLHLEMNKNPDDEWASYDYIQIDPVFGIRASNQYNEMFDLSYYGLSISEADSHYSNVTGHTLEFNYSGTDEQTTLTISQDGLEKTLYNYMTGDYTTTTIEWPDVSGKLALQEDVDNNTMVVENLVNSAHSVMSWPSTFSDANDLASYVKTFIAAIIGQ